VSGSEAGPPVSESRKPGGLSAFHKQQFLSAGLRTAAKFAHDSEQIDALLWFLFDS